MAIYELRTYTFYVGKLKEGLKLYEEMGWPALTPYKGKLVGYFVGDVGAMNQLTHMWKFDDEADRRRHWESVYADADFGAFGAKLRPLIQEQQNKLLSPTEFGPHP